MKSIFKIIACMIYFYTIVIGSCQITNYVVNTFFNGSMIAVIICGLIIGIIDTILLLAGEEILLDN